MFFFSNAKFNLSFTLKARTTPKKIESSVLTSPERSRSKARVSKSQPGSRSASPSSRLNYYTSMQSDSRGHRVRRKSGIPTSTSRESSPNRSGIAGYASMERRLSGGNRNRHYMANNSSERQTPLMAEKILQQSQEAEAALEDALIVTSPRKRYNAYDDQSDESETSRFVQYYYQFFILFLLLNNFKIIDA